MSFSQSIPVIVLAGRTPPHKLPRGSDRHHGLDGCKGAELTVAGRPLIAHVVDRLSAMSAFGTIHIAGPASAYQPLGLDAELIDTDSHFGANIRTAIEAVRQRHPDQALAITTADILPEAAEIEPLFSALDHDPLPDLWFPLVGLNAASNLGESSWKPRYQIAPGEGQPPQAILPGHLVVFRPDALRLDFIYRLVDAAYTTRNRPVASRTLSLLARLGWAITREDVLTLGRGELPRLWWRILRDGLSMARMLARGSGSIQAMEQRVDRIAVWPQHRRQHPQQHVRVPIVDALSLARDIDTEEEAREFDQRLSQAGGSDRSEQEPGKH